MYGGDKTWWMTVVNNSVDDGDEVRLNSRAACHSASAKPYFLANEPPIKRCDSDLIPVRGELIDPTGH